MDERGHKVLIIASRHGPIEFVIHVPVRYSSDAQLDADGNVIVVDYTEPRDPPADGTIALNDDFRNRVIVVDPHTDRIVWQYGRTDVVGHGLGLLFIPGEIDIIPAGTHLSQVFAVNSR